MALNQKQGQTMEGRYIELFRASYEEREENISAADQNNQSLALGKGNRSRPSVTLPPNAPTLRLSGLPPTCTENDVVGFLSEYFVDASQIAISYGPDGRCNGEALLACSTPELAGFILREKNMQPLGHRRV